MKLKLVVAPYYFYNAFMPPLGIAVLAAVLRRNHIDYDIDDLYIKLYHAVKNGSINTEVFLNKDRVRDFIKGCRCDEIKKETEKISALTKFSGYNCVCFSGQFSPLVNIDSQSIIACLMRLLKDRYNPTIVFNHKLSDYDDEDLVDFRTLDISRLLEFLKLKNVNTDNKEPWIFLKPNFEGLSRRLYKFDSKTVISEFFSNSQYFSDLYQDKRITRSLPLLLPYIFIDGCQNNCIFCEFSKNFGFKVKDYDEVITDLKYMTLKYKTHDFFFLNSNINPAKNVVRAFTDKVIRSKIKIRFTDCATFNNLDEDIVIKLRKAGAVRLVIGLESASLKMQKYIGKVVNLDHASRMLKACYKQGIWVELDLLIGLPFESIEDIILTLEFIKDNYKYIRGVNLNRFILKRDSLLYSFPEKYGITNINDDPQYNFSYDEKGGYKWESKKKIMEYRYCRFLACLDCNKVDYYRPAQFAFMVNHQYKDVKQRNKYLDNVFFKDRLWERRVDGFIKELKSGADLDSLR